MSKWKKLIDAPEDELWRGTVLRFSASYPFEDIVDFMLINDSESDSEFSLVCTTGYKAGLIEAKLPNVARAPGKVQAISAKWLVQNWKEWVFLENEVKDIYFIENYPTPEKINADKN